MGQEFDAHLVLLDYCPYLILIAFAVVVRVGSFYVPYLLRHLTQNPFTCPGTGQQTSI